MTGWVAFAAVFTCDDSCVVFSTRHLRDPRFFKVLHRPRQPRLEDESPVAELTKLTKTKCEQSVL